MEQLILIRSIMKPRNYSNLRSLLKEEQGEKISPNIFKLSDTQNIRKYLEKEKITYEIYEKKEQDQLEQAYREAYADNSRERECKIWDVLETEN
jgi:histidinol-phosphate/aromatic aminotransferase/cobyric acid decarboxylase-like protein